MDEANDSRLHETILTLYRGCRDVPLAEFKGWAMERARRAVSFDSGIWVTSDIVSDDFSSVFLFHQPKEMMENYYLTIGLGNDLLAQTAIGHPGHTISAGDLIPRDAFVQHPVYLQHCQPYGMEHSLCTCHVSEITLVPTGMSFYRADPDVPFSEADRRTKELLVPHLIEAMRINLFSWLNSSKAYEGNALAVCDAEGRLYETTPRFPELLRSVRPDWSGPRLNLPFASLAGPGEARWSGAGLKFQATPCQDLFLVSATTENLLDRLSSRQLEIAQMLVKGRRTRTSPATWASRPRP